MSEGNRSTTTRGTVRGAVRGKAELGVAGGVVLLGVFLLVEATTITSPATSNALGPKFFPVCIGALLLLGPLVARRVMRRREVPETPDTDAAVREREPVG